MVSRRQYAKREQLRALPLWIAGGILWGSIFVAAFALCSGIAHARTHSTHKRTHHTAHITFYKAPLRHARLLCVQSVCVAKP